MTKTMALKQARSRVSSLAGNADRLSERVIMRAYEFESRRETLELCSNPKRSKLLSKG